MLVLSQAEKHALYLGTQYVMKTTDGGLHWTQISPDLTGAAAIVQPETYAADNDGECQRARLRRDFQHRAVAVSS